MIFDFEHFADMESGYICEYSKASPYDRAVMHDMELAQCMFADLMPEQRLDILGAE